MSLPETNTKMLLLIAYNKVIDEKINYIHDNPVEEGLVFRAEDYVYSSAKDYAGEISLLEGVIIVL